MVRSNREEISKLLRESSLLEFLPESDLDEIVSRVRQFDFAPSEVVFAKGAPGSYVYWVESGRLRLTLTSHGGGEILYSMVEVGGFCGDLSVLDGGLRAVNAIADRRTHLVGLDGRYLIPVFERNPLVSLNMARLLCGAVRIAGETIENLGLHHSEARIWSRLIHLSRQYGEKVPGSHAIRIAHGLSQRDLADSVGLTRVMVNRQLRIWRHERFTEDGRGYIVILDPDALESFVWREAKAD